MTSRSTVESYVPTIDARARTLVLGALGVVFGDIGTSPLYALRECFHGGVLAVTQPNVIGILSLIVWAQVLLITIKYVTFIMRADNQGQGGILALMALAQRGAAARGVSATWITGLAILGTSLFFGDSMITPAISVLSAVEGLEVAAPWLHPLVVPTTLAIVVLLFNVQHRGTESVGRLFGPVMLLWFVTLALLGLWNIAANPQVLLAFNPIHAIGFLLDNRFVGFVTLGAVFLAITGAEALYADMGHFGARPIRCAWLALVLPALTLNYLGQGALLIASPEAARSPFYLMAPSWMLVPLIVLATLATVIASQAVISGAFSLARQAAQLGLLPRLEIRHTSEHEIGQVYVPQVNWILMLGVLALVLTFRSSSSLASAYGIAVSGTMLIDGILFFCLARWMWSWPLLAAGSLTLLFLVVDLAFLSANLIKLLDGGWFPLVAGGALLLVMITWRDGRRLLSQELRRAALPIDAVLQRLDGGSARRVPGTAVFMTGNRDDGLPYSLLHNLKHNKIVHERIVLLTVVTADQPFIPESARSHVKPLGHGFYRIIVNFGFKQLPDVPKALAAIDTAGGPFDMMQTSFFLGRETLVHGRRPLMARWRERLFFAMSHNQLSATDFFQIPPGRVVELGTQVEM